MAASVSARFNPSPTTAKTSAAEQAMPQGSTSKANRATKTFVYRRKRTNKAPRKRTWIMTEMTRYTERDFKPLLARGSHTAGFSGSAAAAAALLHAHEAAADGAESSAVPGVGSAAVLGGAAAVAASALPSGPPATSALAAAAAVAGAYDRMAASGGTSAGSEDAMLMVMTQILALLARVLQMMVSMVAVIPRIHARTAALMWRKFMEDLQGDCRTASAVSKALLNLAAHAASPSSELVELETRTALTPPVFGDMVHIMDPSAPHHLLLASAGASTPASSSNGQALEVGDAGQWSAVSSAPSSLRWSSSSSSSTLSSMTDASDDDVDDQSAPYQDEDLTQDEYVGTKLEGAYAPAASSTAATDSVAVKVPDQGVKVPDVDVVFVHGVGGGPFHTWRTPEAAQGDPQGQRSTPSSSLWPTAWLAQEFPNARLLSLQYQAHITSWAGESHSLDDSAAKAAKQLLDAGVGQRPVMFVAHSMGGILVKEILAKALDAAQGVPRPSGSPAPPPGIETLASAARGVVFFATPHFGSVLAQIGWHLRHLPFTRLSPSLQRLSPGPHLVRLNERLETLHATQGVLVASVSEGKGLRILPKFPGLTVVPRSSAHPGFGQQLVEPHQDHIMVCKPQGTSSVGYAAVRDMLRAVLKK